MSESKKNVFDIVNERIIAALEKGVVPWHQPWTKAGIPRNLVSGRPYRNINLMLLAMLGYERNLFLTFKQVNDIGAKVRKGERSHIVVFWKRIQPKEQENAEGQKPKALLRYYLVFNVGQCENIPRKYLGQVPNPDPDPLNLCEEIVHFMPNRPAIVHEKHQAFYHIQKDTVNMPRKEMFETTALYYLTLFHELAHSTGHPSRLDRKGMSKKDMESYSIEEMTAEMTASYLASYTGIGECTVEDSASYIGGWLNKLRGDRRFMFIASSQAQKAVDYILDVKESEPVPEAVESAIVQASAIPADMDDLPF